MKFKTSTAIILVAVMITGYFVYRTDFFQRKLFPKRYWKKQIELYQSSIKLKSAILRDTLIELKKLRMTARLEVAQEINFARLNNMDVKKAEKRAISKIRKERDALISQIKILRESIKDEKKKLEYAKKKLSEYQ